jgi:hypothetical protein
MDINAILMPFLKHNTVFRRFILSFFALSEFCLPPTPVFCNMETCRQRCGDRGGQRARRSVSISMLAAAVNSAVAFQAGAFLDALPTCACKASALATSTHTATATTTAAAPSENNEMNCRRDRCGAPALLRIGRSIHLIVVELMNKIFPTVKI